MLMNEFYEEIALEKIDKFFGNFTILSNKTEFNYFTRQNIINEVKTNRDFVSLIIEVLDYLEKINKATLIGTIKTTTDINRVSDNILLYKKVNQDKHIENGSEAKGASYSCLDEGNPYYEILKEIFLSKQYNPQFRLYHSLYKINEILSLNNEVKRCYTIKEREIKSIVKALEAIHPKAKFYVDYDKLEYIWEHVTKKEKQMSRK